MSNHSDKDSAHQHDEKRDLPQPQHQVSMAPTFGSRQDPELKPHVGIKTWLAVFAASLAYFEQLYSLVSTAVSVRAAAATIGGSDISIWMNQVFPVFIGCVGPPLALGTDYVGRRNVLLVVYLILIVGALVSSESTSMQMMIAGRALAGLSAAATGLTTAIPSEVLPRAWRSSAQAVFQVLGSFGGIFGAIIAGYLTTAKADGTAWRYTFRIEAILCGLVFIILIATYHPPPRPVAGSLTLGQKLAKIDILSSILLACFIVPFITALTYGGVVYAWSSANVLAPLIVSCVFFVVFIAYSVFKKDGLVHHDLFSRSRNYALALVCQGFEGAIFLGYLSFFPALCALSFGESGAILGTRVAMPFLGALISVPIVGLISTKTKSLKWFIVVGFIGYTVAMIGLATLSAPENSGVAWFWALLVGLSVGPLLVNLVVIAQLAAPGHLLGLSSALLLACRAVTGAIFVAIATAVVNNKTATALPNSIIASVLSLGTINPMTQAFGQGIGAVIGAAASFNATGLAQALIGLGVNPQQLGQAIPTIFHGVAAGFGMGERWAYVVFAPLAFVAIFCAVFFKEMPERMDWVLDAPTEEIHHDKHAVAEV